MSENNKKNVAKEKEKEQPEKEKIETLSIEEKLKEMFSGKNEEPDAFYGQNTPDPLRHGKHNLSQMFEDAQHHASSYGCKVINLSTFRGGIEVFERRDSIWRTNDFIKVGPFDF